MSRVDSFEPVLFVGSECFCVYATNSDDPQDMVWQVLNHTAGSIHYVLFRGMDWSCDCGDFLWKRESLDPRGCKHIQSTKYMMGYPAVHFDRRIEHVPAGGAAEGGLLLRGMQGAAGGAGG